MATVVGDGESNPGGESALPLDVHYDKVLDFVVDRKVVRADWRKRLAAVQAKASAAAKALEDPAERARSPPASYAEVKALAARLAPGAKKTLLGGLAGAAGAYDAVLKAYERERLDLPEAAMAVVQLTDYDVPKARLDMSKLAGTVAECDRREADHRRTAAACAEGYRRACADLGIEGTDVRKELATLVTGLPPLFEKAAAAVRSPAVGEAMRAYAAFCAYAHGTTGAEDGADVLPVLHQFRTLPEEVEMEPPAASQDAAGAVSLEDMMSAVGGGADDTGSSVPAGIDWGISVGGDGVAPAPTSIDWGISVGGDDTAAKEEDTAAPTSIDWGISVGGGDESAADGEAPTEIKWDVDVANDAVDAPVSIDWGISVEPDAGGGEDAAPMSIDWGITVDPAGDGAAGEDGAPVAIDWCIDVAGAGATRDDPATAATEEPPARTEKLHMRLAQADTRNTLLDDLLELSAFLKQRRLELLDSERTGGMMMGLPTAPAAVREQTPESLEEFHRVVSEAVDVLTSQRARELLMIQSSKRYLNRLVSSLETKRGQEGKLQKAVAEVSLRRDEARLAMKQAAGRLDSMRTELRANKELVERVLTAHFNGRVVNVVGAVANALEG